MSSELRFSGSNGVHMVNVIQKECLGQPLEFNHSRENNLTRGIPMQLTPKLEFDANGVPLYTYMRNHPICVAGPHTSLCFGANIETQHLLINDTGKSTLEELRSREEYDNVYYKKILAVGPGGLEHNSVTHCC